MKKLFLILITFIISSIAYAQPRNAVPDSITAHRTDINLKMPFTGGAFTGNVTTSANLSLGDSDYLYFGASNDMSLIHDGTANYLYSTAKNFYLKATSTYNLYFGVGSVLDWYIDGSSEAGNLLPFATGTVSIGSPSKEVDSVYAQDVEVSNTLSMGDSDILYQGADNDFLSMHTGTAMVSTNTVGDWSLSTSTGYLELSSAGAYDVRFKTVNTLRWLFDGAGTTGDSLGALIPQGSYDIGTSSNEVDTIFTNSMVMTDNLEMGTSDTLKMGPTGVSNIYYTGAASIWETTAGGIMLDPKTSLTLNIDGVNKYNFGTTTIFPYSELDLGISAFRFGTLFATDIDIEDSIVIGSANINEAELEILDGATVTTDELNTLDGVTSTFTELNILDGATVTATDLNGIAIQYDNFPVMNPQVTDPIVPIIIGDRTIDSVSVVVLGGTSVTWNLEYGATLVAGSGTDVFTSDKATTASTSATMLTDMNATTVNKEYHIWLDISAVSGTPDMITVTIMSSAR